MVTDIFTQTYDEIYQIILANDTIEATYEHPFYVNGVFVNVEDLVIGDSLRLLDGSTEIILNIIKIAGSFKVYNFTVDDYHTYFVGKDGILVHNCRVTIYKARNMIKAKKMKDSKDQVTPSGDLIGDYTLTRFGKQLMWEYTFGGMQGKKASLTSMDGHLLGMEWVGVEYRKVTGPKGNEYFVSKDGMKRYRPGEEKRGDYGTQINLEEKRPGYEHMSWDEIDNIKSPDRKSDYRYDYHIDIKD
jgi:hypothetical protein